MRFALVRLGAHAIVFGSLFALGCAGERPARSVRVAAASSLRHVLERATPVFENAEPGVELAFSFAASSTHARQLGAGATFDVFLSADRANLERIDARLVPGSERVFLSNRLALVARAGLVTDVVEPADLARTTGPLAIAGSEVPSGRYWREYLGSAGLASELEARFVNGRNATATIGLVSAGAADFGMVYVTDQAAADDAGLLWVSPPGAEPCIEYVGALLDGASEDAGIFLDWLATDAFQRLATESGFVGGEE